MATIETTSTWNQTHSFQCQPKKRLDRWKVCEDFQNGTCEKKENDCEFAHPSSQKEIRAGIVTVCMDDVNDQCVRPNCKYLHPPTHICAQIHDHKKRPYPTRSRSVTSTEEEQHGFTSPHEDYFPHQYQYPYQFYYPNGQPGTVYLPHYSNNPMNIPGQGYGSSHHYQGQLSAGIQVRGGTEFDPKVPRRSASVSDVPTVHPSILPPYHNQLVTSPPFTPHPHTKLPLPFSSDFSSLNAPLLQTIPTSIQSNLTETVAADLETAFDDQTIHDMAFNKQPN